MSETAPQHPDEFNEIASHLKDLESDYVTDKVKIGIDLFSEAENVSLESIPGDSVVTLNAGGGEYVFYKPAAEADSPHWLMLSEDEEGQTTRTPVVMIGAAASPNGTFMQSDEKSFRKDQFFIVGEIHQFADGAEKGVPEKYSLLPSVASLDTSIVEQNLKMGTLIEKEDGTVVWNVVTENIIPPIDKVTSFSPDGTSSNL